MGPLKCEVFLYKASRIYFVGERVEGQVAINLKSATKIIGMNLHLIGTASIDQDNFEFERQTKTVEMNKILPSGVQKFPIIWHLPVDIISSYKWKNASVSYSFLTEILYVQNQPGSVGGETKTTITTPIEIYNCIDLNTLPVEYKRPRSHNSSYFQRSGREVPGTEILSRVGLDFVLERQCYIPGEFLKFTCTVHYENINGRGKKFPGIRISLEQETSYFKDSRENKVITQIWCKVGPGMKANETGIWTDRFKIPGTAQSTPLETYGVICVQYFLNVTATLWRSTRTNSNLNESNKPQFKIPIIIGSIALNQLSSGSAGLISHLQRPIQRIFSHSNHHFDQYDIGRLSSNSNEMDNENNMADLLEYDSLCFNFQSLLMNQMRPETPPPSYEEAIEILNSNGSMTLMPPPYAE